jgi:hypothetical protein
MKIEIMLPKDRSVPGTLEASDDAATKAMGPVSCLGKADSQDAALHHNPTMDSTQPFGNTPTGDYKIVQLVTHSGSESDVHTYGSFPSILLDPVSGDALKAKQNGRAGLMIHGGVPSLSGGLRPTHGCVRVTENTQRDLAAAVVHAVLNASLVTVQEN